MKFVLAATAAIAVLVPVKNLSADVAPYQDPNLKTLDICYKIDTSALSDYVVVEVTSKGIGEPDIFPGGRGETYNSYNYGIKEVEATGCVSNFALITKAEWAKYRAANPTNESFPFTKRPETYSFGSATMDVSIKMKANRRTINYVVDGIKNGKMSLSKTSYVDE